MPLSFISTVSQESLTSTISQPLSFVAEKITPIQSLRYRMAGLRFDVNFDDESLVPSVSRFAPNYWMRAARDQSAPDFQLRFMGCDSLPVSSETGSVHESEYERYVISAQRIEIRTTDGVLLISPTLQEPLDIFLLPHATTANIGLLFRHALQAALRRRQRYELHAAAVHEPERNISALLIGDSGSGKSTLTVRLAAQGWRFLSDDSVLLQETGGRLVARPFRRLFALTAQTAAACQLDFQPFATMSDKQFLNPQQLFPQGQIARLLPQHLVFLSRVESPTSALVPLTQAAGMMRLLRQSAWACFDPLTNRTHIQCLTQLAQRARAWELHTGRDLLESPQAAAELLAQLSYA